MDFWINQMWYMTGLRIPEDIQLVHRLRSDSLTYFNERSMAISVFDFVERFGAQTEKLYSRLDEIDEIKEESDALYREERYQESLRKLEEAYEALVKNARITFIAISLALLLLSGGHCAERIDLILIGHVVSSYNPVTLFLEVDPSVRYTIVPTSESYAVPLGEEQAKRFIKQYFPRTYDDLASYDFAMYSIPYILPLSLKQISWLRESVYRGDSAALTDQGGLRMGNIEYAQFWVDVGMSDIFANDAQRVLQTGQVSYSDSGYRLSVKRDATHQVLVPLLPLGLEDIPALGLFHTEPKEGAEVVAEAVGNFVEIPGSPRRAPWLMYYEFGKGETWTLCDNFVNPFWCGMYYGSVRGDLQTDVLMNVIWDSVGLELPRDAALVHQIRLDFRDYVQERSLQVSVVEFVDRLGANLASVEELLRNADSAKAQAEELYLEQDYSGCQEELSRAFEILEGATELSLEQKRKALLWIYVIEWTAVTGTLMLTGAVIYSLMVKRRLYREVGTTQAL